MNVFVVTLLAWHVKVHDFVLVRIVNVVSGLEVQLGRFFVFNNGAEGL
jgi:hypothetical protein